MSGFESSGDAYLAALGLAWLTASGGGGLLGLLKERGATTLWRASAHTLESWGLRPTTATGFVEKREHFDLSLAQKNLSCAGLRFLPYDSPEFPVELKELGLPPAGLFVAASAHVWHSVLALPRITIVGTRRVTSYGARVTQQFSTAFAQKGVVVVSGMALGVDGLAHRFALEGGGLTIGVLGCGVDVIYPPRNRLLYQKVRSAGVLASEFPPGCPPTRWNFPRRNRILAALGDAVLVTEASLTSGALQTANWALELGRPVFSVPGPVSIDSHRGCNSLLYDGAVPALDPDGTVEDFLEQTRIARRGREPLAAFQLGLVPVGGVEKEPVDRGDPAREKILRILSAGPSSVDNLLRESGLGVRELTATLARMELAGIVARAGTGMYIRCR